VLRNAKPRLFRLTDDALVWLEAAGVSSLTRQKVARLPRDVDLDETLLSELLEQHVPGIGAQTRKWVVDALAVAAYQAHEEWPIVKLVLCDGALQFSWVTDELALCWVHEGRHYKHLDPWLPQHRAALATFLTDFWAYYAELLAYRQQPSAAERARLEAAFDRLFATETGYTALDERIALTRAKKTSLLLVLVHPEIPLHNNPAELGARQRVRKRDVSFGPRTAEGVRAWDTFMTLAATATKLGVSFYHYIHDRVSGANRLPALADLIDERAKDLHLDASWTTP
jgi:Transposase IS66 family